MQNQVCDFIYFFNFCIFFTLAVLGIEPRASGERCHAATAQPDFTYLNLSYEKRSLMLAALQLGILPLTSRFQEGASCQRPFWGLWSLAPAPPSGPAPEGKRMHPDF